MTSRVRRPLCFCAVGMLLEGGERPALAGADLLRVRHGRRAAIVPGRPTEIDALPLAQQLGEDGELGDGYRRDWAGRDRARAGQGECDGESVEPGVAGARHSSI